MAKPSISVAMATYNGAPYLAAQLRSLLQQTVAPEELVVTDDRSTDETRVILASFAAFAPFPVRIEINDERLGYRANFLKAANLCRSDVIFFCDQDDVWLPRKLETCLEAFKNGEVLLAYHDAAVVTGDLVPLGTLSGRGAPAGFNPSGSLDPWHYGLGFTLSFRRDLLAYSDLWPQSIDFYHAHEIEAHDQWFFFLASALGGIAYIEQPLVLYRQHGANTCGYRVKRNSAIRGHIANLLATNMDGLRSRALCAGRRANILEAIAARTQGERRAMAARASTGYRKLENVYRLRQELYTSLSRTKKLHRLVKLVEIGSYNARRHWGVGVKALARDIVRGLLIPVIPETQNPALASCPGVAATGHYEQAE